MILLRTKYLALMFSVLVALFFISANQNILAETTIPNNFRFERTLRFGAQGEDVRHLQILLNRDGETRINAPGLIGGAGAETGYFGLATKNAIGKFQLKYASEVLAPAGLSKSTGIVGPLTRNKLNRLFANASLTPNVSVASPSLPALQEATPLTAPATSTPPAAITALSFDEVNQKTRAALVNIICTTKRGGSFNLISGSGITIDPRGVILTNAHLGQYFLLQDFPTPGNLECVVRTGEPARNRYRATPLFISPFWVRANASKINDEMPTGTGEHDFALLLIASSTSETNPLPEAFPFIPMDTSNRELRALTEVLVAAYPVGFLSGITIQRDLYPSSAIVKTVEVYSFGDNAPDIFSIGGSVVAQQGSSGGAVVSRENKLIGLIVTSSSGKTTGERDLHALTLSHIAASFRTHTGDDISALFVGNIKASAQSFNEKVAPDLRKLLEAALTAN